MSPTPTAEAPDRTTDRRRITAPPPRPYHNRLLQGIAEDAVGEVRTRRGRVPLPAGSMAFSARNTHAAVADPLRLLLEHYERFGPVFTIRTLHDPLVWAIGPEANHQILVSEFDAFSWREGRYRDLGPLLGNGMLNIDGAYHRQMRGLMLPAFHREQVASIVDRMVAEGVAAADRLRPGDTIDLYHWTRDLALRIALRALAGIEADSEHEHEAAEAFETALSIHGRTPLLQVLRGPGTPYARAMRARDRLDALILGEIERRRRAGDPGPGVLGMLLEATDGEGEPLPRDAVRDQLVTLLFAGHDTTTATLTFMFYELGRATGARAALEEEIDALLPGRDPVAADLDGKALPVLERTLEETLRRYPPAWIGPRRVLRDVTLAGVPVPAGATLNYSSWATHHLPHLYPDPLAFDPDRFLPDNRAQLPKGAYVPFGGGSRMCLGKRFGETELRALTAILVRRLRLEPDPARTLRITTTPTLGPVGGLRFRVRER
ncbi:MAG: cytochrome P450 [Solirubrobacteraceae bacterium]|nr:cytochrome P450 [Solirubrobacteraceae bacterium]